MGTNSHARLPHLQVCGEPIDEWRGIDLERPASSCPIHLRVRGAISPAQSNKEILRQRTPKAILFIFPLLAALLASCARHASSLVPASWPEQYAAADGFVKGLDGELYLMMCIHIPYTWSQ